VNCTKSAAPTPVTVKIGQAGGKEALVDADGCALYVNTQDTADTSACDAQCTTTWPPLMGPATAGEGVTQDNLGVFSRTDGAQQATYFGHQLYYNTGDTAPGQATGQAMAQTWYLIDKDGNPITS
jgi:predicted lipoprotein with Yx(FWY)xxD motif